MTENRHGKRTKVVILALALALVGITTWLVSRPQYPFLHQFQAVRLLSQWVPPTTTERQRCYSFDAPFDRVLVAAERDMAAKGWKVEFKDNELAIFLREIKGQREEATLAAHPVDSVPHDVPSLQPGKCVIWLPYNSNWIEDQMATIEERLGSVAKPEQTTLIPYLQEISYTYEVVPPADGGGSNSELKLHWRNLTHSLATVTVSIIDVNNYETDDLLPATVKIPARSSKEMTVSFPHEVLNEATKALSIKYAYSSATASGTSEELWQLPEPEIGAEDHDGMHELHVHNREERRDFEIRNLEVDVDGLKVKAIPGVNRLLHGTTLRIPFKLPPASEPELKFEYRLAPNKRWRVFTYGDE